MSLKKLLKTVSSKSTRFQVVSDLHLEVSQSYQDFNIPPYAPFLLLAGDIGRLSDYEGYRAFLQAHCGHYERIFLVLGNHEFYGISRAEGFRLAASLEKEEGLSGKLVVLHRTRIDLESHPDITILGCTLQSHIPAESRQVVVNKVNDFKAIRDWTTEDHNAEHDLDVAWLQSEIEAIRKEPTGSKRRIIVVTHFAPSIEGACRPEDKNNPWSAAFATNILGRTDLPLLSDVQYWVYGHTQYSADFSKTAEFSKGEVKLISNQRGYVLPSGQLVPAGGKPGFDVWKAIRV